MGLMMARIGHSLSAPGLKLGASVVGVAGTVTVVDGDTLSVTTTLTGPTTFLGLIGITTLTVEGTGTADLITEANEGAGP